MLDDVGQKLTCGSEKQAVGRRPQRFVPLLGIDGTCEMSPLGGHAGQIPEGWKKSRLIQHCGMQLCHKGAQQLGRFEQCVIDPVEGGRICGGPCLMKVLTCGQHVLQGAVVQVLRECPMLTIFECGQFGDEFTAVRDEATDGEHA